MRPGQSLTQAREHTSHRDHDSDVLKAAAMNLKRLVVKTIFAMVHVKTEEGDEDQAKALLVASVGPIRLMMQEGNTEGLRTTLAGLQVLVQSENLAKIRVIEEVMGDIVAELCSASDGEVKARALDVLGLFVQTNVAAAVGPPLKPPRRPPGSSAAPARARRLASEG